MRTIEEMRQKYWSEENSLWPAKRSKVAVPFCWDGFKPNRTFLKAAQIHARLGANNSANYALTAAYKGGSENDAFWNQFI